MVFPDSGIPVSTPGKKGQNEFREGVASEFPFLERICLTKIIWMKEREMPPTT